MDKVEPEAHDYLHRLLGEEYEDEVRDKMTESCVMSTAISLKRIADVLEWWQSAMTNRGDFK